MVHFRDEGDEPGAQHSRKYLNGVWLKLNLSGPADHQGWIEWLDESPQLADCASERIGDRPPVYVGGIRICDQLVGRTITIPNGTYTSPGPVTTTYTIIDTDPRSSHEDEPKEDTTHWTEHDGQSYPKLMLGARVKVQFRNGTVHEDAAGGFDWLCGEAWSNDCDIIKYLALDDAKYDDEEWDKAVQEAARHIAAETQPSDEKTLRPNEMNLYGTWNPVSHLKALDEL